MRRLRKLLLYTTSDYLDAITAFLANATLARATRRRFQRRLARIEDRFAEASVTRLHEERVGGLDRVLGVHARLQVLYRNIVRAIREGAERPRRHAEE